MDYICGQTRKDGIQCLRAWSHDDEHGTFINGHYVEWSDGE